MDDRELLVEDALQAVQYRVYPDTPLSEVVDLMVRRSVRAVPVVGESYEVLGIITLGDALAEELRRAPEPADGEGKGDSQLARDVMTRTVLCVSEDQPLDEAGQMTVNRDVDQLPVVREGELIGFVTRESILRALQGGADNDDDNENDGDE